MMRFPRFGLGAVVVLAVAAPQPAAADMAAWKQTAAALGKFLPKPLPGWKGADLITQVVHSAFQKEMYSRKVFHANSGPAQINIYIGGRPGWKGEPWPMPCLKEQTSSRCKSYTKETVMGRTFLIYRKAENLTYHTFVDGRIGVMFAGKWTKAASIEAYVKRIDFAGLAKVK
jgi:hypothetical protein